MRHSHIMSHSLCHTRSGNTHAWAQTSTTYTRRSGALMPPRALPSIYNAKQTSNQQTRRAGTESTTAHESGASGEPHTRWLESTQRGKGGTGGLRRSRRDPANSGGAPLSSNARPLSRHRTPHLVVGWRRAERASRRNVHAPPHIGGWNRSKMAHAFRAEGTLGLGGRIAHAVTSVGAPSARLTWAMAARGSAATPRLLCGGLLGEPVGGLVARRPSDVQATLTGGGGADRRRRGGGGATSG